MIINDLFTNKRTKVSEGMAGKVVFRGTGADGSTYKIIQSSPTDFMIHANGRHIDTYGSLQRAMSVLKNEVLGLQQGMAENNAVNVPPGQQAITQPDGSTRISKPGSVSRADYAKNMAAYKAQTQTPEKIADFKQRMASGQGYTDTERQANLQQQQQHFGKYADTGDLDEQGMAEGRFQDDYPEYGGKDKNKAMTYDRNAGLGYEGEPWSDSNSNWSGDNPNYADSTYEPEPVILQGPDGKQTAFSPDSPEVQGVYDREYGIKNKLGQITKAFQKGIDFNANRPTPYTNLATSDSTNDFSDPIKLGQYDVDFPEQTVINPKNGEVTTIPSPNNPTAPYQKPAPATSKSQVDLTKFGINPDSSKSKSNLVVTDKPAVNKPAVNKSASSSSIPTNPKPGSWQELAKLNNITDPRKLKANTYIKTPDGGEVFVNKGDTLSKLAQKMRPTGTSKRQGMEEDDGFDDITTFSDKRTTDQGGKTNQTYSSTTIAKNPTTGQQQSLASWDHTDPKTGKNYSGTNYIDPQGNAEVQKNYKESKKTKVDEVSLGDYRKKATVNKAMAQTNKFFGRDDPAAVAAADRTIAKRERGLGRADARSRPYTAPPVDQDKQRRDLADKYPNIDELVRRAELRRDPQYDRADGQAYYDGRDAEQNYHRLKQIQRMIRGAELDEMSFGGVNQTTDSATGDITTSFNQGPVSVSQTKTPGGYTKQTDQQFNLGTATLGARTVGPNIGAGQLAGTTTKTATNTATGQAKQQVKGVGFGGATGATVGKNYVGSSDDELAKYAANSATGINEEPGQVTASVPGASFTADKNTNTLSATTNVHGVDLTATRNMTPGGAKTFSASTNVAPNLNMTATQKSADYSKGQLAGTKAVSANYTDTTGALGKPGQQHTATRTAGVGFGGATGAKVGKNYVDQYSVNESIDRIRHLAGIKQSRV